MPRRLSSREAYPGSAVPYGRLVVFLLIFHVPVAAAQFSAGSTGLELHAGYGGGGLHPDGLVGGGVNYGLSPAVEGTAFLTAVTSRSEGRAVFGGAGVRLTMRQGAVRPYLAAGPLLALRSYDEDSLGGFASLGLDTALPGADGRWRAFVEGRAMHDGGDWTQIVGGVRVAVR